MSPRRRLLAALVTLLALAAMAAAPAPAQSSAPAKPYAVSAERAMDVTRTVLQRHGFELVRVVHSEDAQVIYYRGAPVGAEGTRPIERIVIRTVERRVVFEDTPAALMADIDRGLSL
jgi:hypothetical protein